jgi:alcohol dehydrogenase class IV
VNFSFYLPTKIFFGYGSLDFLVEESRILGMQRTLIVTDQVMVKTGIVEKVLDRLKKSVSNIEIFDRVEAEPKLEIADAAANAARNNNFDSVIGVGGGSAMDIAKLASAFATNDGPAEKYVGNNLFHERPILSIMLPTTAGTGAELTITSMVTVNGHKRWINSSLLLPTIAIVDPELTITMPKNVTASTGLDALSHNTEAYLSTDANALTDAAALEGIRLISENLERVYFDGENRDAREAMSLGALLGGVALHARMVYGHSVGYTLATRFNLPHGISCGVPLPYVIAAYSRTCGPKMKKLADAFGISEVIREKPEKLGLAIAGKVRKILVSLGVQTNLKDLGVKEDDLPMLAKECLDLYGRSTSPLAFDLEKMIKFYNSMWNGEFSVL